MPQIVMGVIVVAIVGWLGVVVIGYLTGLFS